MKEADSSVGIISYLNREYGAISRDGNCQDDFEVGL
jgi:hypothetical protein